MLPTIVVAIAATSAVYAGGQDCGHGHAACAHGYGFTQRACMSCGYGPGCSSTRPFNYRIAFDYPWTVPSYGQARAIMISRGVVLPCDAESAPSGKEMIEEESFSQARATDEDTTPPAPPFHARKASVRRAMQR